MYNPLALPLHCLSLYLSLYLCLCSFDLPVPLPHFLSHSLSLAVSLSLSLYLSFYLSLYLYLSFYLSDSLSHYHHPHPPAFIYTLALFRPGRHMPPRRKTKQTLEEVKARIDRS
jgi:hypothetical protein